MAVPGVTSILIRCVELEAVRVEVAEAEPDARESLLPFGRPDRCP